MKDTKIVLELDAYQVERLVAKMPTEAKIRLMQRLEKETWTSRLDGIVTKIRGKFKGKNLTDKEITRICQETRQRLYNERNKSHN